MKGNVREEYIPEGNFPATIVWVEERTTENGEVLSIGAKVVNSGTEYDGAVVSTLVDPVLAPGSRLIRIYEAVLDVSILPGDAVDTDQLVGKPVTIKVELREGKDGEKFPRITDIEARKE